MPTMSYLVVGLVTEAKLTRSASMTMCRFSMLEVRVRVTPPIRNGVDKVCEAPCSRIQTKLCRQA